MAQQIMSYQIHPTCQIPSLAKIYEDVFGPDFIGSFVEVGAFDGMTYSNTWGLANAGWNGIYIEAHPDFAARCAEVHAENENITVLPYACSDKDGEMDLIIYGEISTSKLSRWNREWGMNEQTPKVRVKTKRLEQIVNQPFDLLVVDVEEMEVEVMAGFEQSLRNYDLAPRMIIIELHEKQGTNPDQKGYQAPIIRDLLIGYNTMYVDSVNTIFVKWENRELFEHRARNGR